MTNALELIIKYGVHKFVKIFEAFSCLCSFASTAPWMVELSTLLFCMQVIIAAILICSHHVCTTTTRNQHALNKTSSVFISMNTYRLILPTAPSC